MMVLHEPVGQSYHCHQESDCKASSGITWQECPKRQGILSCYGKGKVQRFLAITNNTTQEHEQVGILCFSFDILQQAAGGNVAHCNEKKQEYFLFWYEAKFITS